MHAGWNFLGKTSAQSIRAYGVALLSGLLILSPLSLFRFPYFYHSPPEVYLIALGAGLFQALYFSALLGAYTKGDLSVAYPLARTLPVLLVLGISLLLGRAEQISVLAMMGMLLVAGSAFFLPSKRGERISLSSYINASNGYALIAAMGTTGYSLLDDAALKIFRDASGPVAELGLLEISLLYLFFEALSAFILFYPIASLVLPTERTARKRNGNSHKSFGASVLMGGMIYLTYSLVLLSLAYVDDVSYTVAFRQLSLPLAALLGIFILKEKGNWVRISAVSLMTTGLILVALA